MAALPKNLYTSEDYLAFEEKAQERSEYYQGRIVAMVGASINHNRIASNLTIDLGNALEAKTCEIFSSDLRLWIEKKAVFAYPDILILCDDPIFYQARTDTITNPTILIEILSNSTATYDRTEKFQAYWTLPSLQAYILVDQYQYRVEYFSLTGDQIWELRVFNNLDDHLVLQAVDVSIPLHRIYRNVIWSKTDD